jgi:transposase-like protein
MAFRYSTVFRDAMCRQLHEGERVEDLARECSVSVQTLYRWKRQALIDAGIKPGVKSFEPNELQRHVDASRS